MDAFAFEHKAATFVQIDTADAALASPIVKRHPALEDIGILGGVVFVPFRPHPEKLSRPKRCLEHHQALGIENALGKLLSSEYQSAGTTVVESE